MHIVYSTIDKVAEYGHNLVAHTTRMKEAKLTKLALQYNTDGRRNVERPKKRWRSESKTGINASSVK
jgi:hypothetical protein